MFFKTIRFALFFFITSITWQLIVDQEVRWLEILGICLLLFLFTLFYNWTEVPYQWKKENQNK